MPRVWVRYGYPCRTLRDLLFTACCNRLQRENCISRAIASNCIRSEQYLCIRDSTKATTTYAMEKRSGEGRMDFTWENRTGPVDENSPFITHRLQQQADFTAKKREHMRLQKSVELNTNCGGHQDLLVAFPPLPPNPPTFPASPYQPPKHSYSRHPPPQSHSRRFRYPRTPLLRHLASLRQTITLLGQKRSPHLSTTRIVKPHPTWALGRP